MLAKTYESVNLRKLLFRTKRLIRENTLGSHWHARNCKENADDARDDEAADDASFRHEKPKRSPSEYENLPEMLKRESERNRGARNGPNDRRTRPRQEPLHVRVRANF